MKAEIYDKKSCRFSDHHWAEINVGDFIKVRKNQ
jgi:hypothetical protein